VVEEIGPLTAFVSGLLTAFTPCVYPAIPLTVAAFGARTGSWRRRALLALVFTTAMALVYGGLGALAALGGRFFGEVGSHPAARIGSGGLVLALGLSLLGVWNLRLPAPAQRIVARAGSSASAALRAAGLGAVSGLVSASCTGPVLLTLLIAASSSGEATAGVSLLFLFALGVSLPFFVLAVLLERLPRSGWWLEITKVVLGSAVVASGVLMALAVLPEAVEAIAWEGLPGIAMSLVAVATGVVIFWLARERRGLLGLAAVVSVLGFIFLLQRWLAPVPPKVLAAPPPALPAAVTAEKESATPELRWEIVRTRVALEEALARAKSTRRPVLLDFFADWCKECHELEKTVFSREDVRLALARFATVRVDVSKVSDELRGVARRYSLSGVPALVWISSAGEPLRHLTLSGLVSPKQVLEAAVVP
jgi:thiol:disulfide interchange protein DsbD